MLSVNTWVDRGVTVTGIAVVLLTTVAHATSLTQVLLVTVGLLFIQAGVWRLANRIRRARKNPELRARVDAMIKVVREAYNTDPEEMHHGASVWYGRVLHNTVDDILLAAGADPKQVARGAITTELVLDTVPKAFMAGELHQEVVLGVVKEALDTGIMEQVFELRPDLVERLKEILEKECYADQG